MAKQHVWTADDDALFATMSNAQMAANLNLPLSRIVSRRSRLGVPSPSRAELVQQWATVDVSRPAKEIAAALGWSRQRVEQLLAAGGPKPLISATPRATIVYQRTWTSAEDALLGTQPDGLLGIAINRGRQSILKRRALLKIPAFKPAR